MVGAVVGTVPCGGIKFEWEMSCAAFERDPACARSQLRNVTEMSASHIGYLWVWVHNIL